MSCKGYFTKYGDGACDLEVIGDLYKAEVWELARYLKLPLAIINKMPSAELYVGQTDEGQIGEMYKDIDAMLQGKKKMSERIFRQETASGLEMRLLEDAYLLFRLD